MLIYQLLTLIWILFYIYWFVSSFSSKKTIKRNWGAFSVRILIIIALIMLWNSNTYGWHGTISILPSVITQVIGLLLVLTGIGVAIWARIYLGKNWGMPMSLKENPELVTKGPYSFIRHPIYTGILLAMVGSMLITGIAWLVALVVFSVYFIYSATKEEGIMIRQFPEQYPQYKKKTKMLIPFIF